MLVEHWYSSRSFFAAYQVYGILVLLNSILSFVKGDLLLYDSCIVDLSVVSKYIFELAEVQLDALLPPKMIVIFSFIFKFLERNGVSK